MPADPRESTTSLDIVRLRLEALQIRREAAWTNREAAKQEAENAAKSDQSRTVLARLAGEEKERGE